MSSPSSQTLGAPALLTLLLLLNCWGREPSPPPKPSIATRPRASGKENVLLMGGEKIIGASPPSCAPCGGIVLEPVWRERGGCWGSEELGEAAG